MSKLERSFRNSFQKLDLKKVLDDHEKLEVLSHVSDTLADDCLKHLHWKAHQDVSKVLHNCDSAHESIMKFKEQIGGVPEWVNWDLVRQGQDVFWKYMVPVNIILTNYSLAGGLAANDMANTLECNGSDKKPPLTNARVMNTSKFVLDVMKDADCLRPWTGEGWSLIVRVRMLHAKARWKVIKKAKYAKTRMHMKETDLPINQEHLLYTLCEFSIVVITNLRKMGINPTPNEVTAYLHLWHVIGYYLGVTEEFSKRIVSENGAAALFVEMEKDLVHPGEAGNQAAKALLGNMALRPPMFWPYNLHGAVMRKLVGVEITSSLGIEPTPWYWKMIASGVLFNVRLLHSSNLFVRPRIYLYRKFTPPLWVVLSWIGKRISSMKGESEEKGGCQFERPKLGPDTSKKY